MLRALRPPLRGRLELWDATAPGLILQLTSTGVCTWSVRARTADGQRVRSTIGRWPAVGVAAARKQARLALGQIAAGINPSEQKRQARRDRAARNGQPTVPALLAQWRNARQGAWSARYLAEVERLCTKVIEPKLGNRLLNETGRADWVSLIAAARRTAPATATWLYSLCSSFLNHAEAHGWVAANVLPRKGLATIAPRVASRARILTDGELRNVWFASEALRPKPRTFVRLLILTAARQLEVADIAIGEVDLEAARWVIPASRSKNRQSIAIPLHSLLMDELASIWPEPGAGANYKLLGAIDGSGFRGFSKLKLRLDELSGVTDWRWHDLRRTARSGMSRLGVSSAAAEAALNHISGRSRLEQTYDRYDYSAEAAAALTRWQNHVESLVEAHVLCSCVE